MDTQKNTNENNICCDTKNVIGSLDAPTVAVQSNPEAKWESKIPDPEEQERMRVLIQHLINTKTLSAAQSYCCQCALENQKGAPNANANYIPIIMMPISAAEKCPFGLEDDEELKSDGEKPGTQTITVTRHVEKDNTIFKPIAMQRFTDFDLLSQW